jgi:hypothetical protein
LRAQIKEKGRGWMNLLCLFELGYPTPPVLGYHSYYFLGLSTLGFVSAHNFFLTFLLL